MLKSRLLLHSSHVVIHLNYTISKWIKGVLFQIFLSVTVYVYNDFFAVLAKMPLLT